MQSEKKNWILIILLILLPAQFSFAGGGGTGSSADSLQSPPTKKRRTIPKRADFTTTKPAVNPVRTNHELDTLDLASSNSLIEYAAKELEDLLTSKISGNNWNIFDPVWLYPYFLQYKSPDNDVDGVDDAAFMEAINHPPGRYIKPLMTLLAKSPIVRNQGQPPIVHLANIISQSANDNNCHAIRAAIDNFFMGHPCLNTTRFETIKIHDDTWFITCQSLEKHLKKIPN